MTTREYLCSLMRRYQTSSLVEISSQDFRATLERYLHLVDAAMEGYLDSTAQRDLSIKFHWGHNHDFGDFSLVGWLEDHHIDVLAEFVDRFRALPLDLVGKKVLDVGCWTGGTSLLLAAMGAEVLAIEEVRKYSEVLSYLKLAFKIDNLVVRGMSLYDCNDDEFFDCFDYVLFSGIIYHLTDPIVGTRIAFNALKDGGAILVESMVTPRDGRRMEYWGPSACTIGSVTDLSRGGWHWFVPSPEVLVQMMQDVGLTNIELHADASGERAFAVGLRERHRDINRAGLSVPRIR